MRAFEDAVSHPQFFKWTELCSCVLEDSKKESVQFFFSWNHLKRMKKVYLFLSNRKIGNFFVVEISWSQKLQMKSLLEEHYSYFEMNNFLGVYV